MYWTDSETCLRYIKNDSARFQTFVNNRVAFIRAHSEPNQWNHVSGKENPADVLSRGSSVKNFLNNNLWKFGPTFLRKPEKEWKINNISTDLPDSDSELKKKKICLATVTPSATEKLLHSTSTWITLKRKIAIFLKFFQYLKNKTIHPNPITVQELQRAEIRICSYIQRKAFPDIYKNLKEKRPLKKHRLGKLNPYLDDDDVIHAARDVEVVARTHLG